MSDAGAGADGEGVFGDVPGEMGLGPSGTPMGTPGVGGLGGFGPTGGSIGGGPAYGGDVAPPGGLGGDVDVGGGEVEGVPQPRAWEAKVEEAEAKRDEQKEVITRKRRRRSLLTEEEGGLLGTSPVQRRSILGR